ncbi:MAG: hypothetical protein JST08_16770 [Actinobacteria bacterium]|nr:hypothetical protein [Actinomycetota bacterium]
MGKLSAGLATIAVICALAPAQATAAVTCNFDSGAAVVTVSLSADEDRPELSIGPGTEVVVSGSPVLPSCTGLPEIHKVRRIDVLQPGANHDSQLVIRTEVPFAPGAGDASEGAGAPELELRVDLGSGSDVLTLVLGESADTIRLGSLAGGRSGVNLNTAAEPLAPDGDDISMSGVDSVTIFAGSGGPGDVIDGRGGPEFTGPLPLPMSVAGSEGADQLSAGTAGSFIAGEGGDDTLRGGPGNDTLRGNAGRDTLAYDGAHDAVTVNLTASGPQGTGGGGVDTLDHAGDPNPDIEDLIGSPFADILIGSAAANRIVGGDGVDTIAALDGADEVRIDDAVPGDRADCGPGADSAAADALGAAPLDTLVACEAVALVDRTPPTDNPSPPPGDPVPSSPPGEGAVSGGATPDRGTTPDTTPPRLRLSWAKRGRLGSTVLVWAACPEEACSVRGSGALRIGGTARSRPLRARPIQLPRGGRGALRFNLSPPARKAARRALHDGRRATAAIAVSAGDASGNVTTLKRTISLR